MSRYIFKNHIPNLYKSSLKHLSTETVSKKVILYENFQATTRLRILAAVASSHCCYWVGYGGYLVTSGLTIGEQGLPTFVIPNDVIDAGLLSLGSPFWAAGGLAMSGILLMMAKLNANAIVGEVVLVEHHLVDQGLKQPHRHRQKLFHHHPSHKNLLIKTHNFFGILEQNGTIYEPWNAANGSSITEYNETKDMITYKPVSDTPTYHRIIDTVNGTVIDKSRLIESLEQCRANTILTHANQLNGNKGHALNKNRSSAMKRSVSG